MLLAWTVGHPIRLAEQSLETNTRCLFIFTDLAYNSQDDTIFEHLGLDIIGKVTGVLSWEVIPSDSQDVETLEGQEKINHDRMPQTNVEEQLVRAFRSLSVVISTTKRGSDGEWHKMN